MKSLIVKIPVLGAWIYRIHAKLFKKNSFDGSSNYWEKRYTSGGNSGSGSYGDSAEYKATVLNEFLVSHEVENVIEFGCGDGNQFGLINYPAYIGFDVSKAAVKICREKHGELKNAEFKHVDEYNADSADLTLSLDVIYHLVENDVFDTYMRRLFDSAQKYVIIYSTDTDDQYRFQSDHLVHRKFTEWVEQNRPEWSLYKYIKNDKPISDEYSHLFVDFFIYSK